MAETPSTTFLHQCWQVCWQRARRPVEGVLLPPDDATSLATSALRSAARLAHHPLVESDFLTLALRETTELTLQHVATLRRCQQDPQLYHDPNDRRYPSNLNLDHLQLSEPHRGFFHPEWNQLPPLLRPLALPTLKRKGLPDPDAEDLFSESLAELARLRPSDQRAPILDPTVFEELIPLHARMLQFRTIDWRRKRESLKNLPNHGDSFDPSRPDHEPSHHSRPHVPSAPPSRFEDIYRQCREALSPAEWSLLFRLYVSQSDTVQELIEDPTIIQHFGLKPHRSASTRRRALQQALELALEKLRTALLDDPPPDKSPSPTALPAPSPSISPPF